MLQYVLICLCLALAGVAGLQFMYMFYLERMEQERRKRIQHLERECRFLRVDLLEAEAQLAERDQTITRLSEQLDDVEEEIWADVLDDR
jgi:16S rRNA C1402 (ribose-2'-O) methylase RsmI